VTWDWSYTWSILPQLLQALTVAVAATLVAFVVAAILGLLLALGRRSSTRAVSWVAGAFVQFIRSTPLLVQLYFIFYVLPLYGLSLTAFAAGVLGLGVHYSTYLSEVYRAGINSVSRGQWEAATALNLPRSATWLRVILPQAIPPVIPVLGNYLLTMFKDTPLLSAITLVEMLQTAKILGSESFRYVEPFTIVGLLFLAVSYPSAILIRRLEIRVNRR
jgi:polar amino acid transport system permease protein